jgi:hypothetical protein
MVRRCHLDAKLEISVKLQFYKALKPWQLKAKLRQIAWLNLQQTHKKFTLIVCLDFPCCKSKQIQGDRQQEIYFYAA